MKASTLRSRRGILSVVALVDLDFVRSIYKLHNSAGEDFPELLARDFCHADVEFVEFASVPGAATHRGRDAVAKPFRDRFKAGAMRVEDLELTALDERRALAAFRICMLGTGSGANTSMRLWNLITSTARGGSSASTNSAMTRRHLPRPVADLEGTDPRRRRS